MPCTRSEARGHVGEGQDHQGHVELDQDRDEEETREVDEADHVDGKLGDDEEDPGHQLEECAGGEKSPANIMDDTSDNDNDNDNDNDQN